MSTVNEGPLRPDAQYAGLRLTADQFFDLPEDPDHRYELVNGLVIMSPSPTFLHQDIVGEVLFQL